MSHRDKWGWVSRLSDVGQLALWTVAGALAVGGFIARSGYLSGLPAAAIATYGLVAAASVMAIVAFVTWLVRSRPRPTESQQLTAPVGSLSEQYTVEAARKHEEAARKHEADKLRLEEEARRTKEQLAALEKEAFSSKTSAKELSNGFVEAIRLFQAANQRSEIAHKAIVSIDAALKRGLLPGQFSGLLGNPPPAPERIADAEKIISRYWNDRVKASAQADAVYKLPPKTE